MAAKAPLYFKKGIDDAESEWSQHHAKRWIDTSAKVTDSFPAEFFSLAMVLDAPHLHRVLLPVHLGLRSH